MRSIEKTEGYYILRVEIGLRARSVGARFRLFNDRINCSSVRARSVSV